MRVYVTQRLSIARARTHTHARTHVYIYNRKGLESLNIVEVAHIINKYFFSNTIYINLIYVFKNRRFLSFNIIHFKLSYFILLIFVLLARGNSFDQYYLNYNIFQFQSIWSHFFHIKCARFLHWLFFIREKKNF